MTVVHETEPHGGGRGAKASRAVVRVVALAPDDHGDESVGRAVVRLLRRDPQPGLELCVARDAIEAFELLVGAERVVIVDSAVGDGEAGEVRLVEARPATAALARTLSTHGLDVGRAVELARLLHGSNAAREVFLIEVLVDVPGSTRVMCPRVREAVPRAADMVRRLATGGRPEGATGAW